MDTAAISQGDFFGDLLAGKLRNRMRRRDFHFLVYCRCADIKRTAKDKREAQHIVDLIRIVRPTCCDDTIRTHRFCGRRRDFRIGIGHRKDDRFLRHFFQECRCQCVLCRQAKENVGTIQCFFERPPLGFGRMRRFPLIHPRFAALINHARPVAHDDIVVPHAHRFDQRGAGNCCRACAVDDNLHVLHFAPGQVHRIDQARRRDDCGAMLIIMHDRDFHPLFQCLFDDETFGRFDVFKIDPAEAWFQQGNRFDEFVGVFGGDFEIDRIDISEAFEQDGLAFHHGF